MIRFCKIFFPLVLVCIVLASCAAEQPADQTLAAPYLIQPDEIFETGTYIMFENVKISFDGGTTFLLESNRDDIVCITLSVVSVKTDGSYEFLQCPAFYGIDEQGNYTNKVNPHQNLKATAYIFDISSQGYSAPDANGDGYYDITFAIHSNQPEEGTSVSTADPETKAYKLKAS